MSSYNHVESQEMYLKAIAKILKKQSFARAIDVSEETGYAKSSVSRAMSILERDGYIVRNAKNFITLTEKGEKTVKFVEDRFCVVKDIFILHGLTKQEAEITACEVEHFITEPLYLKLKDSMMIK